MMLSVPSQMSEQNQLCEMYVTEYIAFSPIWVEMHVPFKQTQSLKQETHFTGVSVSHGSAESSLTCRVIARKTSVFDCVAFRCAANRGGGGGICGLQ